MLLYSINAYKQVQQEEKHTHNHRKILTKYFYSEAKKGFSRSPENTKHVVNASSSNQNMFKERVVIPNKLVFQITHKKTAIIWREIGTHSRSLFLEIKTILKYVVVLEEK